MHKYQDVSPKAMTLNLRLYCYALCFFRVCPILRPTNTHSHTRTPNIKRKIAVLKFQRGVFIEECRCQYEIFDSWLLKQLEKYTNLYIQCGERPHLQRSYNCVIIDFDTKTTEEDENTSADECNLYCCIHCLN